MKLIIDCHDATAIEEAIRIVRREADDFAKYDRVGWGWAFGNARTGHGFFVRRIKDGLSIKQSRPDAPSSPTPQETGR